MRSAVPNTAPKKLHRFYVDSLPAEPSFVLTDKNLVHQISRVLSMTVGDSFVLFSEGTDDAVVEITSHTRHELQVRVVNIITQLPAPRVRLIAAISIPKRDTFELIVQKLTELGVTEIVPLISERTVKQSVRIERLQAISNEAVEQCGGNRRVVIHEPMELGACIAQFQLPAITFDRDGLPLSEWNQYGQQEHSSCIMYIGPEGGWSDGDRAKFADAHAYVATLGPRTLRTDTAAIISTHIILWNSQSH